MRAADQVGRIFEAGLAVGLLALLTATGLAQEALTLEAAARKALESHPAIEAAAASEREAAAGTRAAEAGYLPRVSWMESYTRSNNPVYVFGSLLNQKQFGPDNFAVAALNNPDSLNNFQSLVRVEQTLFDAQRTKNAVRATRLAEDLNVENRRGREASVLLNVARTYFGVVLAQEGLAVSEDSVSSAAADLNRAQAVFEAGMSTQADVLAVRVHLGQAEQRRIQAAAYAEVARAALNDALGVDLDAQWKLATPLTTSVVGEAALLERYLAAAAEKRPGLRATALGEQISAAQTAASERSLWPVVVAQGVFEADRQRFVDRGGGNWLAGVSMRWDLWRGGESRARIAASREAEVRAAAESREAYSAAALEIRRAYADLQSAAQRTAVAASVVDQAEESLRIIRDRYEAGLEDVTALLRSEAALTDSLYRRLGSLYEQRVTRAALEHAAGTLTLDSEALR
ncbi:MAG: TolC family protein [Acidobacteria bacterium]|nr:TolC family protein [Acidobacteriota bacterium]